MTAGGVARHARVLASMHVRRRVCSRTTRGRHRAPVPPGVKRVLTGKLAGQAYRPRSAALNLRQAGHQADHVRDVGLRGRPGREFFSGPRIVGLWL